MGIKQIDAERYYSAFVTTDGNLYITGNYSAPIEMNGASKRNSFVKVAKANLAGRVDSIAIGNSHALVVRNDKTLWAAGDNYWGQFGAASSDSDPFVQITVPFQVKAAYARDEESLVLDEAGNLYGAGRNNYGELGLGNATPQNSFVKTASDIDSAMFSGYFTVVKMSSGELNATGVNNKGQYGGLVSGNYSFAAVSFSAVQTSPNGYRLLNGIRNTLILTTEGDLYATGEGDFGQLGNGRKVGVNQLTQIIDADNSMGYFDDNVLTAVGGNDHLMIIDKSGKLWVSGRNEYGQLGIGSMDDKSRFIRPSGEAGSGFGAAKFVDAAGYDHSIAHDENGNIWVTGNNGNGQLGLGDNPAIDMCGAINNDCSKVFRKIDLTKYPLN